MQDVQDQQSSSLIVLYGFKIERESSCGNQDIADRTVEFWEYLNYTLEQHIIDRSKRGVKFTYHEIWHVIQVVLKTVNILNGVGLLWEINPSTLEITP